MVDSSIVSSKKKREKITLADREGKKALSNIERKEGGVVLATDGALGSYYPESAQEKEELDLKVWPGGRTAQAEKEPESS